MHRRREVPRLPRVQFWPGTRPLGLSVAGANNNGAAPVTAAAAQRSPCILAMCAAFADEAWAASNTTASLESAGMPINLECSCRPNILQKNEKMHRVGWGRNEIEMLIERACFIILGVYSEGADARDIGSLQRPEKCIL